MQPIALQACHCYLFLLDLCPPCLPPAARPAVYDGAVYLHQGRTYLCKKLDLDARVAVVRPADLK